MVPVFLTTCDCGTCSILLSKNIGLLLSVLQLWTLHGLLNRLHHCDLPLRQEKDFGDLVDGLLSL